MPDREDWDPVDAMTCAICGHPVDEPNPHCSMPCHTRAASEHKFFLNTFTITVLTEDHPLETADIDQLPQLLSGELALLHEIEVRTKEIEEPETMLRLLVESGAITPDEVNEIVAQVFKRKEH